MDKETEIDELTMAYRKIKELEAQVKLLLESVRSGYRKQKQLMMEIVEMRRFYNGIDKTATERSY